MGIIKISEKNDNFQFNSNKEISIYHPDDELHFLFFILDKKNYFSFIMNGVY